MNALPVERVVKSHEGLAVFARGHGEIDGARRSILSATQVRALFWTSSH